MPAVQHPTNDPLIGAIVNWAADNTATILQIYSQKGGWEGWMQVELARKIIEWLGGSCWREYQEVYINNGRADILQENPLNNTGNVIELKCQSVFQDELNIAGFAIAYAHDAEKINVPNRKAAYKPYNWYVIGIAPGGTGTGGAVAMAIEAFSNPNWPFHNSTYWIQRDQYSPVVFWTTYR